MPSLGSAFTPNLTPTERCQVCSSCADKIKELGLGYYVQIKETVPTRCCNLALALFHIHLRTNNWN